MSEVLWQEFLDTEVDDINVCLALYGITGILGEFETWLRRKGHIICMNTECGKESECTTTQS